MAYTFYDNNLTSELFLINYGKLIKESKQKSRLGTASYEITGELQLVCGRPALALSSALVPQTLSYLVCVGRFIAHKCIILET